MQGTGQRYVVEVVAGRRRVWAVLAPAGHPAVDQTRVAGQAVLGADSEPLRDSGTETLQQRVCVPHEGKHGLDAFWQLEIDADGTTPPVQQVERRTVGVAASHG